MTQIIAKDTIDLCDYLSSKCWRNKKTMIAVKELRNTIREWYKNEMKVLRPEQKSEKIIWKELVNTDAKQENRNSTSVGHLQWRKKGFKRQEI